jgi:hypothetical protein
VIGLFGAFGSIVAIPFVVSIGVNKAGGRAGAGGEYWQALSGAVISSVVLGAINAEVLRSYPKWVWFTAPASTLILIPAASALTYHLFSKNHRKQGSLSLLNMNKGKIGLGSLAPVIYPDPRMNNKICTQFSLLTVTF